MVHRGITLRSLDALRAEVNAVKRAVAGFLGLRLVFDTAALDQNENYCLIPPPGRVVAAVLFLNVFQRLPTAPRLVGGAFGLEGTTERLAQLAEGLEPVAEGT